MGVATIVDVRLASGSQQGIAAEVVGIAVGALLILAVITGLVGIFSRTWRQTGLRIAGLTVTGLVALYAVGRGIAEFWTVNYSDPASYEHSWGGPSLAGVFAVHGGPGFVIVIAAVWWLARRLTRKRWKTSGRDELSYPLDAQNSPAGGRGSRAGGAVEFLAADWSRRSGSHYSGLGVADAGPSAVVACYCPDPSRDFAGLGAVLAGRR